MALFGPFGFQEQHWTSVEEERLQKECWQHFSQGYSGPPDELCGCRRLSTTVPMVHPPETVPQPSGTVMDVAESWGMIYFALERAVEPEIVGSTTLSGTNFQQQSTFLSCSSPVMMSKTSYCPWPTSKINGRRCFM